MRQTWTSNCDTSPLPLWPGWSWGTELTHHPFTAWGGVFALGTRGAVFTWMYVASLKEAQMDPWESCPVADTRQPDTGKLGMW